MEKEIRIKDLIFSIWDKRVIFSIVAAGLVFISFLTILLIGMNTKVYKTEIELQWDNIEKFSYPDNTRISRTDFIQEEFLLNAEKESGIDINIDKLYSDELIKTNYIQEELSDVITLNIELDLSALNITEEQGEVFIDSLKNQYLSFVSDKAQVYSPSVSNFDSEINELIFGYDVFNDALSYLELNLEVVNENNPSFSYESKVVRDYNYRINELKSKLVEISTLMVSTNSSNQDVIYTHLNENDAINYISSLGYAEKLELIKLEDELATLEAYCTTTLVTDSSCAIELIYEIKIEISELEDTIKNYVLLSDIIDNNNYVFEDVSQNTKLSYSNFKGEIETEISNIEEFVYEFNMEYLTMDYKLPMVYTVDSFGGILFYALALIASSGMPVVFIWIFEDWDKRIN